MLENNFVESSSRLLCSTPALDAAELAWWETNAAIEDRFCWVQTPEIQKLIRRAYLRPIVASARASGDLLDVGCGAGWLSILLARSGAMHVTGIDFSPAQLRIASDRARASRVSDLTTFQRASISDMAVAGFRFGTAVMHAFLHHLSVTEIQTIFRDAQHVLRPGGKLFLLEPVTHGGPRSSTEERLLKRQAGLLRLMERPYRFRRVCEEERVARQRIDSRMAGEAPRGVSPKEQAFTPGEIERLAAPWFRVTSAEPVLISSFLVAQEWLLFRLSHPVRARVMFWPILASALQIEREFLAIRPGPASMWVFNLFECESLC